MAALLTLPDWAEANCRPCLEASTQSRMGSVLPWRCWEASMRPAQGLVVKSGSPLMCQPFSADPAQIRLLPGISPLIYPQYPIPRIGELHDLQAGDTQKCSTVCFVG